MAFISDFIKCHFFLFNRALEPLPTRTAVLRFIAIYILIGVFFLWAARQFLDAQISDTLTVRLLVTAVLCISTIIVTRLFAGKHWPNVGLRALSNWNRREILYVVQIIPIALAVFYFLYNNQFIQMITENGPVRFLFVNFLFGLIWGFYQEFVYRGVLQNALSTLIGPIFGVLATTLIFTFGPLHFSIYKAMDSDPNAALLFAPIFGIGLVFGIIFQRSGNLWIPAILHGLWPLNMAG